MTKPQPGMRIIALEEENVKRIKAVSIKPTGAIVEITGNNGEGKSSLLDGMFWALTEAKHIQDVPVRRGADRAVIRIDLGEGQTVKLRVTRVIRAKEEGGFTHSLKVENDEGAAYKSPQAMLDALVGALSFDPLEFVRMDPKKQFEACRRFVPKFDFDADAAARKLDFDKRTEVNRVAKALRAQADGVKPDEAAAKLTRADEAGLVAELESAGQHNAEIERRSGNRERAREKITSLSEAAQDDLARAAALRAQAEDLEKAAATKTAEAEGLVAQINAAGDLPEPIDTSALRQAIEAARAGNAKIDAYEAAVRQRGDFVSRAAAQEEESKRLTKAIEDRDAARLAAIAAAKLPVEGLSFGDGAILLDGLPFEQASGAEQLRVSCAVAAALNPKLRVLRVKDGALLDADSMALLASFAEANDMQVWVETVASGRPGAVVIEDGMVKGAASASEAA